MKWLGQYIQDLPSRFRDDVYLEDLTTTTDVTLGFLAVDSNGLISKNTTLEANIEAAIDTLPNLTGIGTDGQTLNIYSSTTAWYDYNSANAPKLQLLHLKDDATGPWFEFHNTKIIGTAPYIAVGLDGDVLGTLNFSANGDAVGSSYNFARIYADIHDATDATVSGRLTFQVQAHGGGLESGLVLTGGSQDDEVDVTLGLGAASVVTVPGSIAGDVTGDLTGTADLATTVTITDNENTTETNAIIFTAGGALTGGSLGLESDGDFTYNPGTGTVTSTEFVGGGAGLTGIIVGATQPAIESIGTDGDTLAILSDQLHMGNTTADTPVIKLTNTTNDNQAGQLILEKLRADDGVASGQNLGEIWFRGQNNAQQSEDYAYIIGEIDVSTDDEESGILKLGVANNDGELGTGLLLTGGDKEDEIDATVGLGTESVVTIPGTIRQQGYYTAISTGDGSGTGTIPAGQTNIYMSTWTTDANDIIILPNPNTCQYQTIRISNNHPYELRSHDSTSNAINGGTHAGGAAESAIPGHQIVDCFSGNNYHWTCTQTPQVTSGGLTVGVTVAVQVAAP